MVRDVDMQVDGDNQIVGSNFRMGSHQPPPPPHSQQPVVDDYVGVPVVTGRIGDTAPAPAAAPAAIRRTGRGP